MKIAEYSLSYVGPFGLDVRFSAGIKWALGVALIIVPRLKQLLVLEDIPAFCSMSGLSLRTHRNIEVLFTARLL